MLILAAGRGVTAYDYICHCPHTLCRSFIEIVVDAAYHMLRLYHSLPSQTTLSKWLPLYQLDGESLDQM